MSKREMTFRRVFYECETVERNKDYGQVRAVTTGWWSGTHLLIEHAIMTDASIGNSERAVLHEEPVESESSAIRFAVKAADEWRQHVKYAMAQAASDPTPAIDPAFEESPL
jgi:hypothetical protein